MGRLLNSFGPELKECPIWVPSVSGIPGDYYGRVLIHLAQYIDGLKPTVLECTGYTTTYSTCQLLTGMVGIIGETIKSGVYGHAFITNKGLVDTVPLVISSGIVCVNDTKAGVIDKFLLCTTKTEFPQPIVGIVSSYLLGD